MRSNYRLVEVASPIGARTELTARASKLLGDLEARDYLRDSRGACWLVDRPSTTLYALVVPVDYSKHGERLRGVSLGAIAELEQYGLIAVAWADRIPDLRYGYRDSRDGRAARPVTLTDLGRQRLRRYVAATQEP